MLAEGYDLHRSRGPRLATSKSMTMDQRLSNRPSGAIDTAIRAPVSRPDLSLVFTKPPEIETRIKARRTV